LEIVTFDPWAANFMTSSWNKNKHQTEREERWRTLFVKAQKGESSAYRVFLEEMMKVLADYYQNSLRKYGRGADSALISDLVQETLLAIHQKRATYQPSQPFGPWLFAIARYKMIDSFRKNSRETTVEDWGLLEASLVAENVLMEVDQKEDLEILFEALNEKQKELLRLLKMEGLSVREVSARLAMSESAVKVAVHRAMKILKEKKRSS
jgi:RNA polymerase sigma-70 factor (ECF subfamily)